MGILRSYPFTALDTGAQPTLTPTQQRMYKDEKLTNFRLIAHALQSTAPTTLTRSDAISGPIVEELKDLGQFTELAYSIIPLDFAFAHMRVLAGEGFPLEGYEALCDARLVSELRSQNAGVLTYIAYRERENQLVVAFAGTATLTQVYYDLFANLRAYPGQKKTNVHSGFWSIYASLQPRLTQEIKDALGKYPDVREVVLAGHSMGGALAYLLGMDLLGGGERVAEVVNIVTFGCPRVGDKGLLEYWWGVKGRYEEKYGVDAVREHTVRAHKDGVPALPPLWMGYRHLCRNPLYFAHNTLFRVPESDRDFGLFNAVAPEGAEASEHPKGGHNYYNGRDMERGARRMGWLEGVLKTGEEGWVERYREKARRWEVARR